MKNHRHRALAAALACLLSLQAGAQGLKPAAGAAGLTNKKTPAAAGKGASGQGLSRALAAPPSVPASGAQPAPAIRQADYIVAVVNSEPITNNEVNARLARVQQSLRQNQQPEPPYNVLAREVLERLILEKVLLQRAKESGIRVDDYSVNQAAQNVARQNGVSDEEMYKRLAADGITPQQFREELRNQIMTQRLRDRELESRVRVTDADVEQYLRDQQRAGGDESKYSVNLGHILIRVPEDASPADVAAAQARAQSVADQARAAGADFAALARQYSDAPEAKSGGQLGLRTADRYPELFLQATAKTPVNGIAGPIRSPAGFHVLKVIEKTSAGVPAVVTQNHVRHILLRTNAQLTEAAAAARLADYRRRVLTGQASFESLAREYSQDGSAKQGGDLGWAAPGRYVPEFEQAVERLKPGEISEPVISRFGVHLIQLVERRDAPISPREQRELAREALREKKLEEAYVTWTQEQRGRAYVEYRDPPQ